MGKLPLSAYPLLSVVVPVRNRPYGIEAVLRELASQALLYPYAHVEVVVVDDCSVPPLALSSLPGLMVTLLRNDLRMGANASRARGFAASKGLFVNFHDSDDSFDHDWLKAVTEALIDACPQPDVLVTRRWDDTAGQWKPRAQTWFERNFRRPTVVKKMLSLRNCLGPFGGVIFSRSILSDIQFPDASSSQDWLLYLKVFDKQPVTAIVSRARFVYRLDGPDRISADARAKVRGMFAVIRATRHEKPFSKASRFYQLNRFSSWIHAYDRKALVQAWRNACACRTLWSALVFVYAIVALRLR